MKECRSDRVITLEGGLWTGKSGLCGRWVGYLVQVIQGGIEIMEAGGNVERIGQSVAF